MFCIFLCVRKLHELKTRGAVRGGGVVLPLVRSGSIEIFGYAFNCPQAIVRVEVELEIDVELEVAVPSRVEV